jgi:hypothetical protein
MNNSLLLALSAPILALSLASPGYAHAESQTCELVEPGLVTVDGLLDDWRGIGRKDVGGKDQDLSFTLRCAYDNDTLHIAVDVRDDYLYREKQPRAGKDDTLIIELSATDQGRERLQVFPGNDKVGPTRQWNGKGVPRDIAVEDTQQRRGWSMEASVPLRKIRGYGKGSPGIRARIEYRDADFAGKTEGKLAFQGTLAFQASSDLYRSFLKTTKLSARDIRLDVVADVDGIRGPERVIAGKNIIGVISDQFFYMELPVRSPSDISRVKVVDLRGDGTMSIITEMRQYGNGGSRDLVAVWQVQGNGTFKQVLAFEVRKQLEGNVLVNRWSLVPRGKHRKAKARGKGGHDLLVEVGDQDATGFDEDNYNEIPAPDVRGILTPWSDQTSAVYYFEGNAALGGEPATGLRTRPRPKGR